VKLYFPPLQENCTPTQKNGFLEARGVEPLSSSLSTQTSTCLSGEIFEKPALHRHTADFRASTNFLHRPARSLRRAISLLSTFGAVAGVQLQTSRSIKPRERDLGDLRLFVLARFFTRPTNHPRHAACASNDESKPVRPHCAKHTPPELRRQDHPARESAARIVCDTEPYAKNM
jgi:hypothetical protein